MFTGVKSCAVAGAVALGAGVVTFAPIEPPPTQIAPTSHSSAVELTAIPSPLQFYPELIARSINNLAALGADYLADPLPVTRATIENQMFALGEVFTALRDGDGPALITAVTDIVVAPGRSAKSAADYLGIIANQPGSLPTMAIIAVSPLLSGLAATGAAVRDVIDAVSSFDVIGLVNAVLNVPGRILDGVLNGGYPLGGLELPGLIKPVDDVTYTPPGPIASLLQMTQGIGAFIRDERDESEGAQLTAGDERLAVSASEAPALSDIEAEAADGAAEGSEATDEAEVDLAEDVVVADDLIEAEESTAADASDTDAAAAEDDTPRTGDKSAPRGAARHASR